MVVAYKELIIKRIYWSSIQQYFTWYGIGIIRGI